MAGRSYRVEGDGEIRNGEEREAEVHYFFHVTVPQRRDIQQAGYFEGPKQVTQSWLKARSGTITMNDQRTLVLEDGRTLEILVTWPPDRTGKYEKVAIVSGEERL